jgi:Putative  PD-(D/E)XK family member, (DUF4420)
MARGEPMNPDSAGAFAALGNKASTKANLRIRETDLALAGGAVLHAIDFDGRPLLLVPLTEDQQGVDDEQSRGVSLHTRTLVDEATPRRFIAARCELPGLVGTFGSLCDDLIAALAAEPLRPAETSLTILDRWRELLGAPSNRLMPQGVLLGVLCELHLLEQLAQLAGPSAAVSAWTGPGSERQDFMSGTVAIEVKGTGLRDRIAVEIHGLRQLEEPAGGRLFLWVEHVERATDDGDSVPDAIDRLASEGVSRHAVLTMLAPLGYLPSDEDAYRTVRFRLLDRRAYEVVASFPRLIPAGLTQPDDVDRLLNVRYTLDLTDRNADPKPMEFAVDAVNALAEAIR